MGTLIRPTLKSLLFPLLIIAALSSPAVLNAATLNLTWKDNTNNEDGFKIYRKTGSTGFTEIAMVGANIETYTDSNLTGGSIYCYRVAAFIGSQNSAYTLDACGFTPVANDTDGDGLTDTNEINTYGTNPLLADTDGDGIGDGNETNTNRTSPTLADTDGDGISDGLVPILAADFTGDGITDLMVRNDLGELYLYEWLGPSQGWGSIESVGFVESIWLI